MLPFASTVEALPNPKKVIVMVSDSMRQDLMVDYASQGLMPSYQRILDKGVVGQNGMIPNVIANTGPGWTSLITGATPAATGVTNNTFHNNTQPFSSYGVSAWGYGVNQAETLAAKADAEGISVAALGWQALDTSSVPNGVVVDSYPDWLTGRGVVSNYEFPLSWTNAISVNPTLANDKVTLVDATGWTNTPNSYSTAQEASFSIADFSWSPVLNYQVFIYDSTNDSTVNYDRVIVSRTKDATDTVTDLAAGEWSNTIPETVNDYLGNPNEGGLYMKLINLEPDLSEFRLYHTQVTRIRAFPQTLEDDLASQFDALIPSDYSPYLLGLIDVETFVEQNTMTALLLGTEIYPYVVDEHNPDLVLMGNEWTDMSHHRFNGFCDPTSDVYNPATGDQYCDYIKGSYQTSDAMLDAVWDEMGNANVFVTSDHGVTSSSKAINANYVLELAGLYNSSDLSQSQAVAYIAGGAAQVYINLEGRNPGGIVAPEDYATVRQQVVDAFDNLGTDKIERIVLKEDTVAIPTALGQTYNMLNEDTTGDVVIFSKSPYQFDAATPGQIIGDAPIYGQHGYVPNGDLDRYAVFAAYGPRIKRQKKNESAPIVTIIDIAPTVAELLGIDAPAQSEGRILPILK